MEKSKGLGRVFDTFCFLDEIDLLEFRLEIINEFVDVIIISQAYQTHLGKLWTPLINKEHPLISKYCQSIEFVFVFPEQNKVNLLDDKHNWLRENNQRKAIDKALFGCIPEDIIMVSDVDEIPSIAQLQNIKSLKLLHHAIPMITTFSYFNLSSIGYWKHSKVSNFSLFPGSQELRRKVGLPKIGGEPGVHFSVVGGNLAWEKKFQRSPHREMAETLESDIPAFLSRNLYPSKEIIKFWKGGRLRFMPHESLLSNQILFLKLLKGREIATPCPNQKISKIDQIIFAVDIALKYKEIRFSGKNAYFTLDKLNVTISKAIKLMIYGLFFPVRLYSILRRIIKIRSLIKIFMKFFGPSRP